MQSHLFFFFFFPLTSLSSSQLCYYLGRYLPPKTFSMCIASLLLPYQAVVLPPRLLHGRCKYDAQPLRNGHSARHCADLFPYLDILSILLRPRTSCAAQCERQRFDMSASEGCVLRLQPTQMVYCQVHTICQRNGTRKQKKEKASKWHGMKRTRTISS